MKEVNKIYSAVDAEELEAGDIVILENTLETLESKIKTGAETILARINPISWAHRFRTNNDIDYMLAKLICPKEHAEVYKAWKNGAKVEEHIFNGEWVIVDKPRFHDGIEYRIAEAEKDNDPFAELKNAYIAGKTIQYKLDGNTWTDWNFPTFDGDVKDYRIKLEEEK